MANLNSYLSSGNMVGSLKSLIATCLISLAVTSQAAENLVVKAQPGDGINSVLKRFKLHQNPCNLDSFLTLNNLGPTDYLILDKSYVLPIKVYTYDGSSIRSTISITDYDKAVRIQKYNEGLQENGVKPRHYRDDKILWVPYHELYCMESKNDFKPYTMKAPIMGKTYEDITITDEELKGCVYYLISGHGGPDPGAMTQKDGEYLCEDEYAYDVTLRLARNLLSHGATVYMITRDENDGIRDEVYLGHDKDETCWFNQKIPINQTARLKQRVDAVNRLSEKHADAKLQKMIAIHVDSRSEGEKIDIFFYHYPGSKDGKISADTLLQTIDAKYNEHQKNRGYKGVVKARDLYVLRESKPSAVYIELGNITNDFDQKRLLVVDNRQAIANWLDLGIQKDAARILKK
ncbi:MAG: N-acetylmuramoyl-L-alanine amidase [Flavobacteriales bacterium]|nr:N-acetylmuramoyl-L-alanine amidase [Flavobacteriales bacterium]